MFEGVSAVGGNGAWKEALDIWEGGWGDFWSSGTTGLGMFAGDV